ncbi:FAD-dependent oxidoreductase [Tepidiforma sp.]|uniref:FAD-dependent oxidoreductase n=1 Tax=Tepidiforma sp. TaxID=2682230 RepID=UPI002ADD3D6E|nr:FAD-dependent oxidoreductase [Tepidiforma sp.]
MEGGRGFIVEPERRVPVIAEADVLVVGGGAAGIAAAVAAARQGARTMLVERYGSLGGLATNGLIVLLLTLDDGRGRQVVAGLCQEMVDRLSARGACFAPPREEWGSPDPALVERYRRLGLVWGSGPHVVRYSAAYDPEEFRVEADGLVLEAGVDLRFHRWAVGVRREGQRITHVVFESKAGREAVACGVVVDATGDADVAVLAGEQVERELVHPWLWFRTANVVEDAAEASPQRLSYYRTVHPGGYLHPWGAAERIGRAIDATNPDDLTYAEVECRRLARAELDRLRAKVPGFERAWLAGFAATLGITESRRLVGIHQLSREEMDLPFDDVVAVTGHWTKYGAVYEIPWRSLLARETENLAVAGRCISVDHRVHHATKEIPACFATGEAAGTGAAMALERGVPLAGVAVSALQARLGAAGAWLPGRVLGR